MGCYAAYGGNSFPMFQDNLKLVPSLVKKSNYDLLTVEDGNDNLCRNAGKELPLYAA